MLTDDTLREGLQTPGLSFTVDEKIRIARMIAEAGVKRALVSYPSAHASEVEATEKIISEKLFSEVFALGRTVIEDIDLIAQTGSNISLHLPFGSFDMEDICLSIKHAKKYGRTVEIAIVDVVSYGIDDVLRMAKKFSDCGADVVQLPDTKGAGTPHKIASIVREVKKNLDVAVEIHCHNDLGLSIAEAIAGIDSGADQVDTTVMGIGERNGISDEITIARYLNDIGIEKYDIKAFRRAYEYVFDLIMNKIGSRFFMDNMPILGRNVETVTAGTHAGSFPSDHYSFNVYAGRNAIRAALSSRGISASDDEIRKIVQMVKDHSVREGRAFHLDDVVKIYGEVHESS
ncbi:MAG: hypothetical protein ACP5UV_00010 [Thermoplasmata archaeon]